jgi:2-C-methyl-D-erythritol 4-phosphate cytidylyltransferase
MTSALIVAAGQGVRMGTGPRKQYRLLAGFPVLAHCMKAFDACEAIEKIILVVPEDETEFCRNQIVQPAGFRKPVKIVTGGLRRQDSVFNGLSAIHAQEGIVLIHDGVRPLVDEKLIMRCIEGARKWKACIPVIPVSDTLKQIDRNEVIGGTIARDIYFLAQTPQAFDLSLIREAHTTARHNGWQATDDASLVEQLGRPVHIVSGEKYNLKITTPEDMILIELLLSRSNIRSVTHTN